ncbi:hypothetical protein niasHT_032976 [Heterodera trifolii]|uniref:Transcription factor AP-2 C-terminal domain-containing protein n=1 Tax=Heterodera trifolii TaxID=157864 RepID=A0ABD2HRF4_9BILA
MLQQIGKAQLESDEQPGRLTLLSNHKCWVPIGEIQCGLAQPKCMNASILGSKWRNTKNMDGGQLLCKQPFRDWTIGQWTIGQWAIGQLDNRTVRTIGQRWTIGQWIIRQ